MLGVWDEWSSIAISYREFSAQTFGGGQWDSFIGPDAPRADLS